MGIREIKSSDVDMAKSELRDDPVNQSSASPAFADVSSDKQTNKGIQPTHTENRNGASEPEEKSVESDDKKPEAKRHNTRGRNGIKKHRVEIYSPNNECQPKDNDDYLINWCARSLASLDKRAWARVLIRDANAILEEILLPMSLPWSHPHAPFARIPRDIEDMPSVLRIGCTGPEDETDGMFEPIHSSGLSAPTMISALRSEDPGIIELTTVSDPSLAQRNAFCSFCRIDPFEGDPELPGELSLQSFQEVHARKRLRQEINSSNKKVRAISIRVGSTSSKSTIFDSVEAEKTPLLLPALMPREVLDGKRKSGKVAYEEASELGSYNCRQGQVEPDPKSGVRKRAWVGRTRLIWSAPDQSSALTVRVPHKSLLTGERLESSVHRRPLFAKVGIQVCGSLLSTSSSTMKKSTAAFQAALTDSDPDQQFSHPKKLVNEALDIAFSGSYTVGDHSQCSLNIEKFFSHVLADFESDRTAYLLEEILKPLHVKINYESADEHECTFHPPRLDCTATEDGIITVSCTKPGRFEWVHPTDSVPRKMSTERIIVDKICSDLKICSVCFNQAEQAIRCHSVTTCSSCAPLVNVTGQDNVIELSPGQKRSDTNDSLANGDGAMAKSCAICGLDCGLLVRDNKRQIWFHDVCRIWVGSEQDVDVPDYYKGTCQLCSAGSSAVIRCAAEGCRVRFHPMCGLVASKIAETQNQFKQEDPPEHDAFLCTQFELTMLQTSYSSGSPDDRPLFGKTASIPVGFCSYHNPKRKADHFSLYPGGCYLGSSMRIPPLRNNAAR